MIKFNGIRVYGDLSYRNKKCPKESIEQITFINRIREQYPFSYGRIMIHVKNEAKLRGGQFSKISLDKAMGMVTGTSDIIMPGSPAFVCELKRRDCRLHNVSAEQLDYLLVSQNAGAFCCVAYGADAASEAFSDYLNKYYK